MGGPSIPLAVLLLFSPPSLRQEKTAELVDALGEKDNSTKRHEAYRKLLARKPPEAIPLLIESLPRFAPVCQSLGISLLMSYPRERSLPALRKLMSSNSLLLRFSSAVALFRFGDKEVVDHIVNSLGRLPDSTEMRSLVLSRLTYLTHERIQAAVRSWLRPDMERTLLDACLYHLLTTKDAEGPAAVEILLSSENLPERNRVLCEAYLLGVGARREAPHLVKALAQGKVSSISTLHRFLQLAPALGRSVLSALLDHLKTAGSSSQVILSARILARHGYRTALETLEGLLDHQNSQIVKAALEAFMELGGNLESKTLEELLHASEPQLSLAVAEALRKRDDHRGLGRVIDLVKKGGRYKADAVRILGGFRVRESVRPLIDALLDPDPKVRIRAFYGLRTVLRSLFPYRRLDLRSTGYQPEGAPGKRQAAVRAILVWWGKVRPSKRP